MNRLVLGIGLLIVAVGILGIAAPLVPLEFGRPLLTPTGLYMIAVGRVCVGLLLLRVAPASRASSVLRGLGVLIVIAGVITPFFGVDRSRAVLEWWSSQGATFMRAAMGLFVLLGLFIVYAVVPRRRIIADLAINKDGDKQA